MDLAVDGHFWLPDDEENQIRGRLTWSSSAGGELVLEGLVTPGGSLAGLVPTLLGRTVGRIPVVLVDSFVRRSEMKAQVSQHWRVNGAYLGTFDPEPRTDVIALEIDGLSAFTRTSGLSVTDNLAARDPVQITWTPAASPLSVTVGDGTFEVVDERRLSLEQGEFAVEHHEYLRLTAAQQEGWEQISTRLNLVAALFEFFADRPMPVRRQWLPADEEGEPIDHFFQPILGSLPQDPDRVWLKLADVRANLQTAVGRWTQLFDANPGTVDLIVEEVRFGRSTNIVDRILRVTRILELLHRHQRPEAAPEADDELENVNAVLESAPDDLRGWLGDRLGVTRVRLRQRIRETAADLSGIESILVDVDEFTRVASKTRNWHTHYTDRRGVADDEYAAYLAIRLWLLGRGAILRALGWSGAEAVALVYCDRNAEWVADKPLLAAN